jgi:hypothetical protein
MKQLEYTISFSLPENYTHSADYLLNQFLDAHYTGPQKDIDSTLQLFCSTFDLLYSFNQNDSLIIIYPDIEPGRAPSYLELFSDQTQAHDH